MASSICVWAEPEIVTLDLPTMNCAICPITAKKTLTKVKGLTRADVSYEDKQAIVGFDDDQINPETLINATTEAGYPSTVKQADNQ